MRNLISFFLAFIVIATCISCKKRVINDNESQNSSSLETNYNFVRIVPSNLDPNLNRIQSNEQSNANIRIGTPRNNYAELWSECEELSTVLEENDIEHDELSYPMDYHELKDLKSGYEDLLEDNEIDY